MPVHQNRLSIAPMMDWTDRHYRFMARMLTSKATLYTEMVVVDDLTKKDEKGQEVLLGFADVEHPLALQLGGCDPELMLQATEVACAHRGRYWDEINLNCGCPSDACARQFGARLMHQPELVKQCVTQISRASGSTPVTVKCRLGTNEIYGYEQLSNFVSTVSSGTGVKHFIIHARECVLGGFTPKQNRKIPPLRPRWAHQLQKDFPDITFAINGGVKSLDMAKRHLDLLDNCDSDKSRFRADESHITYGSYKGLKEAKRIETEIEEEHVWEDLPPVCGVMIGREAYNRPWMLREADTEIFGAAKNPGYTRREILDQYCDYGERTQFEYDSYRDTKAGNAVYSTRNFLKPLFGLFAAERQGKEWRRLLDREWIGQGIVGRKEPGLREMVEAAMDQIPAEMLDAKPDEFAYVL